MSNRKIVAVKRIRFNKKWYTPGQKLTCDAKNAKWFVDNKHALYEGAPLVKPEADTVKIVNEEDVSNDSIEIKKSDVDEKPKAKRKVKKKAE